MTDRYKRIRTALAMGPTPRPCHARTPTNLVRLARLLHKHNPVIANELAAYARMWARERKRLLEAVAEDAERELLIQLHAACVPDSSGKAKATAGRLVDVLRERLESAR